MKKKENKKIIWNFGIIGFIFPIIINLFLIFINIKVLFNFINFPATIIFSPDVARTYTLAFVPLTILLPSIFYCLIGLLICYFVYLKKTKRIKKIHFFIVLIGFVLLIPVCMAITAYLTAPKADIKLNMDCDEILDLEENELNLEIKNYGKASGKANICINSNGFLLEIEEGKFTHKYCFQLVSYSKDKGSAGVAIPVSLQKDITQIDLNISIDCSQEIWSFMNKECEGDFVYCSYG